MAEWGINPFMHLATAYVHPTPKGGSCRVRVYVPEEEGDAPVVLCSEMPTNPGLSVTRAKEPIAGEIISVSAPILGLMALENLHFRG